MAWQVFLEGTVDFLAFWQVERLEKVGRKEKLERGGKVDSMNYLLDLERLEKERGGKEDSVICFLVLLEDLLILWNQRDTGRVRKEKGKERMLLDHHFLTLYPTISLVKSSKLFLTFSP